MAAAVRLTIPAARATEDVEESLFEVLAEIQCSWTRAAGGDLNIWTGEADAETAKAALLAAGVDDVLLTNEGERDWVEESSSLRTSTVVGPYLLDPHDGERASDPQGRTRLYLPAARAFGTGSHESTRLAIELLLLEPLEGRRVLDVGCGTGVLSFVAALQGTRFTTGLDLDFDAASAMRLHARMNAIEGAVVFAGGLEALSPSARFDLVIANMILEEVGQLLPRIADALEPGGRLVTSGQLVSRRDEWLEMLRRAGFEPVDERIENEWLGATSVRT